MKRILLVDDDAHIRRLLSEEFEEDGYEIATASNGKDALLRVANDPDRPDVVILDLRMPGKNGLEKVGVMLKLRFKLPLIIFSAYSCYRNNRLAQVADACLVKSSDLSELKHKVHELV